jgi:hypothetical protein
MTTTPETIAELKRLLAESTPRNGTLIVAAVNALPSLLADIELLREALQAISSKHPGYGGSGDIARKALAATEVKP